ncbi:MAG TPA: hypothetical protein VLK65_04530 [Vicinamibacteria bacterium]|nr:hypothetical protein [Vicinamibacteria bacterium]
MRHIGFAFALLASALPAGFTNAQVRPGEPHNLLRTQVGFSESELTDMDGGKAFARVLDMKDGKEVAIVGVVRIRATTDFFLRMFRDIERFDTGASQIKKLSDPPRPEDFANMRVPEEDLKALPKCSLDDCDMKLGQTALELLQSQVDWKAADAAAKAQEILRQRAYEVAAAYRKGGAAALGAYRDKAKPTFITDEFELLLQNSPYILEYRPELHRYLREYPVATLKGAEDFLYWGEYDLGAKPVMRISHVTIYPLEEGRNASVVIASKQLFYSHYFVTGLELTALVRDPKPDDEAFYLLTFIRQRTDGVGGRFGKMLKGKAEDAAAENVKGYLEASRAAIEKYYRDSLSRPGACPPS